MSCLTGGVVLLGIGITALMSVVLDDTPSTRIAAHSNLTPIISANFYPTGLAFEFNIERTEPVFADSIMQNAISQPEMPIMHGIKTTNLTSKNTPAHQQGASPAVERASYMVPQAAQIGLPAGKGVSHNPNKPTSTIKLEATPLKLASLSTPTHLDALDSPPSAPDGPRKMLHTIVISQGDTISDILHAYRIKMSEAQEIVRAMAGVFSPKRLRTGQKLLLTTQEEIGRDPTTLSLIVISDEGEFEVEAIGDGLFVSKKNLRAADSGSQYRRALASIKGSLYETARRQNVPDSVIAQMIRTHSFDVDFQREIQAGDLFEVFFSPSDTKNRGKLVYSSLTTKGVTRAYYSFTGSKGVTDYYNADGISAKKPLMRTPINGARISSRFGMRHHPILGYSKMHGGIDFSAPTGTPILAAGDGVIKLAGSNGGYGTYIKIRHKSGLHTAYAHLSRISKGLKAGKTVRQGDIIGYVGSTGASTGPHLHYEVLFNGKRKNPLTVALTDEGRKLKGNELALFINNRNKVDISRRKAPVEALVADARP
jgi:murein DD-endopeptidase MepM/ murein hydrolase activator NlpD